MQKQYTQIKDLIEILKDKPTVFGVQLIQGFSPKEIPTNNILEVGELILNYFKHQEVILLKKIEEL